MKQVWPRRGDLRNQKNSFWNQKTKNSFWNQDNQFREPENQKDQSLHPEKQKYQFGPGAETKQTEKTSSASAQKPKKPVRLSAETQKTTEPVSETKTSFALPLKPTN